MLDERIGDLSTTDMKNLSSELPTIHSELLEASPEDECAVGVLVKIHGSEWNTPMGASLPGQLLHDVFHVHLQPVLDDEAVADAIHDHQVGGDPLAGSLDSGEFSLVDSAEGCADRDKIIFGDYLMRDEFISWKRGFS